MEDEKINIVKNQFDEIYELQEAYKINILKTGELFNIFSILKLDSSEVRLHSTFIGELLDSDGSHGYGNEFCKLFIKELISKDYLKDKFFNYEKGKYSVKLELYIGEIKKEGKEGGRIDIVLKDEQNNQIFIENKIYAEDQENQLLRYHYHNDKALLLYLTLNGNEPGNKSTNGKIINNKDFYCVSYKELILNWLSKCKELSKNKPTVKETIEMYLNIIKNYTNQNLKSNMIDKIVTLFKDNQNYFNTFDDINEAYYKFLAKIKSDFWKKMKELYEYENSIIKQKDSDYQLKVNISEDSEGFYYKFYLTNNNGIQVSDKKGIDINKLIAIETNSLKEHKFQTNEHCLVWIFSDVLEKFDYLVNDKIYIYSKELEIDGLVKKIKVEFNKYVDLIKKELTVQEFV